MAHRAALGARFAWYQGLRRERVFNMHIPFFRPTIGETEIEAAVAVLRSGWLTTGPKCQEFEENFSELLGGDVQAIAVN